MSPSGQLMKARARWLRHRHSSLGTLNPEEFEYPSITRAEREQEEWRQWLLDHWQSLALYGGGAAALLGVIGWPVLGPMLKKARKTAGKYVRIGKR